MTNHNVLVVDPPWPKRKGGRRAARPNQGRDLDYKTLSVCDIFSLLDKRIFPVTQHTVFLWAIDEFLLQGEQEMLNRGYKRHARLIWDKGNGVAPAFSVRYSHEYLIWFYKPKFAPIAKSQRGRYKTVFAEAPRQHSRKPDIAYSMINDWYPSASKMDVFSREARPGWTQFGDETGYFG